MLKKRKKIFHRQVWWDATYLTRCWLFVSNHACTWPPKANVNAGIRHIKPKQCNCAMCVENLLIMSSKNTLRPEKCLKSSKRFWSSSCLRQRRATRTIARVTSVWCILQIWAGYPPGYRCTFACIGYCSFELKLMMVLIKVHEHA